MQTASYLIRKCVVPSDIIESVLKPVVLAHLDSDKRNWKKSGHTVNILGEEINPISDRYKLFFTKGTTCVACGVEGTIWVLEKHRDTPTDRFHLNLYGLDKDGNEVLITKDHIIPKKHGGGNHLSNYQTMCYTCNNLKDYVKPAHKTFNDTQIPDDYLVFAPRTGPKCPYCHSDSVLVDAKLIHGADTNVGMAYVCANYPECKAYVNCKRDSCNPAGTLATEELHQMRLKASELFDAIWKQKIMTKQDAYKRLSNLLCVKKMNCDINNFNLRQCTKLITLCESQKILPPHLRTK